MIQKKSKFSTNRLFQPATTSQQPSCALLVPAKANGIMITAVIFIHSLRLLSQMASSTQLHFPHAYSINVMGKLARFIGAQLRVINIGGTSLNSMLDNIDDGNIRHFASSIELLATIQSRSNKRLFMIH